MDAEENFERNWKAFLVRVGHDPERFEKDILRRRLLMERAADRAEMRELLRAKLSKCKSTSALSDVKDVDSRESQQLFARKRSETMGSGRGFVCSPQSNLTPSTASTSWTCVVLRCEQQVVCL